MSCYVRRSLRLGDKQNCRRVKSPEPAQQIIPTPACKRVMPDILKNEQVYIEMGLGHEKKNRINHFKNGTDDLCISCKFCAGNKSLLQE